MIFGTVGTHYAGFDRLVRALDELAAGAAERVVIQIGSSRYEPRHAEWFRVAAPATIDRLISDARVVVSHAGAGSLLATLDLQKPTVAVPRLASFGEHIDDHQRELCEVLQAAKSLISVEDVSELGHAVERAASLPRAEVTAQRASLTSALRASASQLIGGSR